MELRNWYQDKDKKNIDKDKRNDVRVTQEQNSRAHII